MKIAIAQKNLLVFFREWKSNLIVFLLPIIFIAVFAFAFGSDMTSVSFRVGLVNFEDEQAQVIRQVLEDLENGDGDQLLGIQEYASEEEAKDDVMRLDRVAVLVWEPELQRVRLVGDTFSTSFQAVQGIVDSVVGSVLFGDAQQLPVVVEPIIDAQNTTSGFDYLAPGLIIYGIIMLIPQMAITVAQEGEKRYVFRYLTSKVQGIEVVLGYVLSHGLIGFLQTMILFGAVQLFGYQASNGVQSLVPALVIAIPTTLLCVGIGLLIGGLVKNSEESSNWGTIVTIILGFLSGAFIQLPSEAIIGTWSFQEIIPTGQASASLRQVLQYGADIPIASLGYISVWAIGIVLIGGWIYTKRQLTFIE